MTGWEHGEKRGKRMRTTRTKAECMKYITVPVTIEVSFPEDMVICDICDFCRTENSGSRYRCMLNSKILPYHNKCIGIDCPLPLKTNEIKIDDEDI